MKKTILLLVLWQAGCAATADTERAVGCGWTPDPEIHGAHLDISSDAAWVKDPEFKKRLRRTIEGGADYWHTGYDVLWGWKILIVDSEVHCLGAGSHVDGCVQWHDMTVKINASKSLYVEMTPLVHEIGHVALPFGDPQHWDAKWWDREALAETYREIVPPCVYYDSNGCAAAWEYDDFYAP